MILFGATSRTSLTLGEAILANPHHQLAYVSCDAFELTSATKTLKLPSGRLAAEIQLLAGALRSNCTLTQLELANTEMADADRMELGKALLENEGGAIGFCDDFDLRPGSTELDIDLKELSLIHI